MVEQATLDMLISKANEAVSAPHEQASKLLTEYSREFDRWFEAFGQDLGQFPKDLLVELGESHAAAVKRAEELAGEVKIEMTAHRARAKHILQYVHSVGGVGMPHRSVKKT